jgi:uncharacterized protein YndB with AHSA1/START domain
MHNGRVEFERSVDIAAPPEVVWTATALGRLLARLTRGITNRYLDYEANGLKAHSEAIARSVA